jgi:SagB-type dehydrogenase family enzyme
MSDAKSYLYRRSPHLVFYWSGTRLIGHNYASRTRAVARPIVCDILHFFDDWRSADDLLAVKIGIDRRRLRRLLSLLVKRSLLQRNDHALSGADQAMSTWSEWNPEAGFFHNSTKDLRYADLRTIARLTRAKERVSPMPSSVKRYGDARVTPLAQIEAHGDFGDTLLARRTWRRFGTPPVDLSAFSTLLGLTAGVYGWLPASSGQRIALKTSPSGGARHPIELYVLVRRVAGLERGLYHYGGDRHVLEHLGSGRHSRPVEYYLPTQSWYNDAAALVFFSAVFPRVQWRYTHPRAYRAALIEAGHFCQTFCLAATWLGLAPFCSMALAESRIERDLNLDGITESVLYAAGVGTRPDDVEWKPRLVPFPNPNVLTAREERRFPGRIVSTRR